jgi:hypothetical protein
MEKGKRRREKDENREQGAGGREQERWRKEKGEGRRTKPGSRGQGAGSRNDRERRRTKTGEQGAGSRGQEPERAELPTPNFELPTPNPSHPCPDSTVQFTIRPRLTIYHPRSTIHDTALFPLPSIRSFSLLLCLSPHRRAGGGWPNFS